MSLEKKLESIESRLEFCNRRLAYIAPRVDACMAKGVPDSLVVVSNNLGKEIKKLEDEKLLLQAQVKIKKPTKE